MPSKDLRAGLKGRSGYRTVRLRGTRGRTFNATLTTRTNATTGNFRIRSGQFKPTVTGATKNTTHGHKAVDTFVDRY